MPHSRAKIRVCDVSGSPHQIGLKLGKLCGSIGRKMVSRTKQRYQRSGMKWDVATKAARNYMVNAESFDPGYVEWLKGYSASSHITLEDIYVLLMDGEEGFCTDVLVNQDATVDGGVYAAHTEDWRAADQEHLVLIRGRPKNEPAFLAMSLGGIELDAGMNSSGLCFAGNSLYQDDTQVGVPKLCLARKLLASRNIGQAMSVVTSRERASSYNINLGHKSGEIFCVEGSAADYAVLYPREGYLVHTNHYLDARMMRHETAFRDKSGLTLEGWSDTVVRYHRARRLMKSKLGQIGVGTLKTILSDHVDHPNSICYHGNRRDVPSARTKTIFALVMDLTRSRMHLCVGNPCVGDWREFALD
jgi:isopenicillin-N N-acyltransferase-like protein